MLMNTQSQTNLKPPEIHFTIEEKRDCYNFALNFVRVHKYLHVDAGKDRTTIVYEGRLGELAFAKYFGLSLRPFQAKLDPGFDFILNNIKIDVKATRYSTGVLPVYLYKDGNPKFKADVMSLVIVHDWSAHLAGWITKQAFARHHEKEDLKWGTRAIMRQRDLWPVNTLQCLDRRDLL
jgi:hypothetical protein